MGDVMSATLQILSSERVDIRRRRLVNNCTSAMTELVSEPLNILPRLHKCQFKNQACISISSLFLIQNNTNSVF